MTSGEVIFNNVEEIVHFVNQAEKIRWDVDVCLGSCIVDGKSLLGVMSFGTGEYGGYLDFRNGV